MFQTKRTMGWDWDITAVICGMDTYTFDQFFHTRDPYVAGDGRVNAKIRSR